VQLLDLTLEFFADDVYWARGWYHDGNSDAGLAAGSSEALIDPKTHEVT
jgi:hypothetical protein